jgi:hypothetical protein
VGQEGEDASAEPVAPQQSSEDAEVPEQPKPLEQDVKAEPEPTAPAADNEEAPKEDGGGEPKLEEKTLVSNMAGESVLEADVAKTADGNDVEPVEVKEEVKP